MRAALMLPSNSHVWRVSAEDLWCINYENLRIYSL